MTHLPGTARSPIPQTIAHPRCFACSSDHPQGLQLRFETVGEGKVRGHFPCPTVFEGYPGKLHGGVISTLLDSAMANCLFGLGYQGYTAELTVKFQLPIDLGRTATVEAWVIKDLFPLFLLEGRLVQDGNVKVTASAKFFVP